MQLSMTDSKFTKQHHPTGSLAFRVLVISLVLLVIPLFVQSIILYHQEYEEWLSDAQGDLELIGKERAHLIEEKITMSWTLLELIADQEEGVPKTYFSRAKNYVKPFYINKIPLPRGAKGNFAMINSRNNAIIIGREESKTEALVTRIPMTEITKDLGTYMNMQMSLVGIDEQVFAREDQIVFKQPIAGTDMALKLVAEKELIHGLHVQSYYYRFATLFFFIGIIGGSVAYMLMRRISKPLRHLCKTMGRVSEGAAHARYREDKWGFEINELGLQFNDTLDGLLIHQEEAERERLHRGKLAEELRIGHDIQSSLLPSHPPGFLGLDIGAAYFAAKEVNGDFYDLFRLDSGKLLIVICDSAGKGVSGCLYSLGLRSMLRSLATVHSNFAEVVKIANDLFWLDAHESSMFSTLWIGLYDPKTAHLSYCSQGHPPAILKRLGEIIELGTDGIALGAQKIDVINIKEIFLEENDLLVLYTDGITEAHNQAHQLFGKKRLEEFILSKRNETAKQITDELIEEIHLFSDGALQYDDMTLIVIINTNP